MKMIKSNNYDELVKALKSVKGDFLIEEIPTEIPKKESGLYHLLLVNLIQSDESFEIKGDVRIVKVYPHVFDRLENAYQCKYDKMYICHNPEHHIEEEDENKDTEQTSAEKEIAALKKQLAIKDNIIEESKKTQENKEKTTDTVDYKGKAVIDIAMLMESDASYQEMKDFATSNGLVLEKTRSRDDVKESLIKAVNEYNEKVLAAK